MICLRVADLQMWLDPCGERLHLFVPPAHQQFLHRPSQPSVGDLVLRLRNITLSPTFPRRRPIYVNKMWELWLDDDGRYIFVDPHQESARWLVIQPDFTSGEVLGNFQTTSGPESYPLGELEIILFANWLAGKGDLILHGAGIEVDQQGYCFLGVSGAGKSTLTAALAKSSEVRVLGEDQIVLRLRDGCFWIYGTPWHLNPDLCSPGGAPLKKIFFLNRYAENMIEALGPVEGAIRILQTALIPYYRRDALPVILERAEHLSQQTPSWSLAYRLGSDILSTVRAA